MGEEKGEEGEKEVLVEGPLKPPGKEDEPDENNFGDQFRSDPPATHSISDCKIMKNKRHFAVEKKTIPIGNFTSSIRYNFPTELPTYYCITWVLGKVKTICWAERICRYRSEVEYSGFA